MPRCRSCSPSAAYLTGTAPSRPPAEEPFGYQQDFVAICRNTAVVVRPPAGNTTDWTRTVIEQQLGIPGQSGADPIVARCAGHTAVLIGTDLPAGGSLLIRGSRDTSSLSSRGRFTADCDVLDAGASLSVVPRTGEPIELRSKRVLLAGGHNVVPADAACSAE